MINSIVRGTDCSRFIFVKKSPSLTFMGGLPRLILGEEI